jgi:UDP-2,3-diacylglucosamine hydrolase
MRGQSRTAQRAKAYDIMDVNDQAIAELFNATGSSVIIHGHTHRPARHVHEKDGQARVRYVLPDWDCDTQPARGGWLAAFSDGDIRRYAWDGNPAG